MVKERQALEPNTQDPQSELNPTTHDSRSVRSRGWLWGLSLGIGLVGTGAYWGFGLWLERSLLPIIETQVQMMLGRSVSLGSVSYTVPWELTIGSSSISNLGTVDSIDVSLDMGRLLTRQDIVAAVTLNAPNLDLSLPLDFPLLNAPFEPNGSVAGSLPIPINEITVTIGQGRVDAISQEVTATVSNLNVDALLTFPDPELPVPIIAFEVEGLFNEHPISLQGQIDTASTTGSVQFTGQDIALEPLPQWIPSESLPISPQLDGGLNTNLGIAFAWQDQLDISVEGGLDLSSGVIRVDPVPYPLEGLDVGLSFQDKTITIDNFQVSYADIPVLVDGSLNFDTLAQPQVALQATLPQLALQDLARVSEFQLPVEAQGDLLTAVTLSGRWPDIEVTGTVQAAEVTTVDALPISEFNSTFTLDVASQAVVVDQLNLSVAGGTITGSAEAVLTTDVPSVQANLDIRNINIDQLAATYAVQLPYPLGPVDAQVQLSAPALDPTLTASWATTGSELQTVGTLDFRDDQLQLSDVQVQLDDNRGQLTIQGLVSANGSLQATVVANQVDLAWIRDDVEGRVSGNWSLSGPTVNFLPQALQAQGSLQFPQGLVATTAPGSLQAPVGSATMVASGSFQDATFWPESVRSQVDLQLPQGVTVTTEQGSVQSATVIAAVDLSGSFSAATISSGSVQSQIDLQLPQGFTATTVQGLIKAPALTADIEASGPLVEQEWIDPAQISARGILDLPEGATIIETGTAESYSIADPIESIVVWDGDILQLEENQVGTLATLTGDIPITAGEIGRVDLSVQAQNWDLSAIPFVPAETGLVGLADLEVQIQGNPSEIEINGELALSDFEVAGLLFEDLRGPLRLSLSGSGSTLDLRSPNGRNQIQANLSSDFSTGNFDIRQDQLLITGTRDGDIVTVQIDDFPLNVVDPFIPDTYPRNLDGTFSSDIVANVAEFTAQGSMDLQSVELADVEAEAIQLAFSYQDHQLQIDEAELTLLDSVYEAQGSIDISTLLSGNLDTASPQFDLTLGTTGGRLQDIVSTFKWGTWNDVIERGLSLPSLGPAEVVAVEGTNTSDLTLMDQLEVYLATLDAQRQATLSAEAAELPLPPPTAVQGEFMATLTVSGSLAQPAVSAQFEGSDWTAEDLYVETVEVAATLEDNALQIEPLRIQTGDRVATFTGVIGLTEQEGLLTVQALPLNLAQRFLPSGFTVSGDLNSEIELGGSLTNPAIDGSFQITQTQVNDTAIEDIAGSLIYDQGLWTTDTSIQVAEGLEMIRIAGYVPLPLPTDDGTPTSAGLDLSLDVPNAALDLVKAVTDEITWRGNSSLNVDVTGSLQEPLVAGNLTLENGDLGITALSTSVRELNGNVVFNLNSVDIDSLTGRVGAGDLLIAGQLPLYTQSSPVEEDVMPLTASLMGTTVDIPNLYEGLVDGQVRIEGYLGEPKVTGEIMVSEGDLVLDPALIAAEPATNPQNAPSAIPVQPQLDDLRVIVGSNVDVRSPNLFAFRVDGELLVNGLLTELEPDGDINLRRGFLDLPIGSGFSLTRSHPNRVRFIPEQGLDPFLDLKLLTRVTEVGGGSEVRTAQTLEITATVNGLASQLQDSEPGSSGIIQLSSQPARTDQEILALLGSSAIGRVASVDTAASLLGFDALHIIGERLGLDELRIGPVIQVDREVLGRTSTSFELEAIKDLTGSLSTSARIPLTTPQPLRFSLRYSLSEELLLRLNTDFQDSSANLSYNIRF